MNGFGDSLGRGSIYIGERWLIEVNRDGGAKVTIVTTFKKLSEEEQSLNEPYEILFREEEKPDYFQCDGRTISDNSIPLNLAIQPSNDESITIDLGYTCLAKKEDSWWDVSLNPRHGAIYPLNFTMECYLPMEAEDIRFRNVRSESFLIDPIHKKAVMTFTGSPYFFKLAYRSGKNQMSEVLKVFISYSEDDGGDLAGQLKRALEKYDTDTSVFVAAVDIDIGESWKTKIVTALNDCDVFIPILTVAACRSNYVRKEIEVAIEKERRIIIPCVYHQVLPNMIPDIIEGLQRITFNDKHDLLRQVLPKFSPHKDVARQVPKAKDAINARDKKNNLRMKKPKKSKGSYTSYTIKKPEQLEEHNSFIISNSELTFTNEDIERVRNSMPLLNFLANQLSRDNRDKPFHGKTFIIALHFLKDLIIFLKSFEKLGLAPDKTYLFWKPYLYPHKDKIVSYLKNEKKYNIYPLDDLEGVLATQQDSMDNIVVLEDGGYIAPLLHQGFENLLEKTIGAVEQTTKGIRRDKGIEHIAIPILNVAEAEIKTRIEAPFVADAAIHNIENLLLETLRGEEIALMGFGVIGSEIMKRLRNKATITVYDPDPMRRTEARNNAAIAESEAYLAVRDKFLVIGSSGETSIDKREILSLKHKTYLVSTSSDQIEINIPVLEDLSKPETEPLKNPNNDNMIGRSYVIRERDIEVRLLADGYPVNFWCSDSIPNQISDLILSVIFLSTFELVVNKSEYPNGIQNVDKIIRKYEIAKLYEEYYQG